MPQIAYNLRWAPPSWGPSAMVTSPSSSWSLDRGPRPPPPPPWPPRCLGRETWSLYRGALKGPLPLRLRCFGPPTRSSCSERRKMKESEVWKQAFNKYKWHNPCNQTSANGPLLGYWLKRNFCCWIHFKLYYTISYAPKEIVIHFFSKLITNFQWEISI